MRSLSVCELHRTIAIEPNASRIMPFAFDCWTRAPRFMYAWLIFSSFFSSGMESSAIHEECEAHNSRNKFLMQITRWTEMNIFILSQRYHKKCARRILNEKSKLRKKSVCWTQAWFFTLPLTLPPPPSHHRWMNKCDFFALRINKQKKRESLAFC